jgi:hypothetical protein
MGGVRPRTLAAALVFALLAGCGDNLHPAAVDGGAQRDSGPPVDASVDATATDDGPAPYDGPAELRVLFIGNSYTYVNDLPGMLWRMADTAGVPPAIATDKVTEGGATLATHWSEGIAQARINEGGWTHVVLQGQSMEADYPAPWFTSAALQFTDLIAATGARPGLFVTWARAAGDAVYGTNRNFINPDEMQDRLTAAYDDVAAQAPGSLLACVGEAFRRSLRDHPEIVLHMDDNSHPNVAGTYLAASTFYVALTGNPVPAASEVPAEVSAGDALLLREVALVGSDCAEVRVKAIVDWRIDVRCHPFDFGVMGASIPTLLFLKNNGYSTAGLEDALTFAPPFAWSAGDAYPGGAGTVTSFGTDYAFCGSTLAAGETCVLSVEYVPTAAGSSTLTLQVTDAYLPTVTCELQGAPTSRALLTISESPGFFGCTDAVCAAAGLVVQPGQTVTRGFVVSNRGGAPTTALDVGTPLVAPFTWGPCGSDGLFPGGSGTGIVENVEYDYCAEQTLGRGEQCVVTVSFCPTEPGPSIQSAVNLGYADADGPVSPNANRTIVGATSGGPM